MNLFKKQEKKWFLRYEAVVSHATEGNIKCIGFIEQICKDGSHLDLQSARDFIAKNIEKDYSADSVNSINVVFDQVVDIT